MVSITRRMSKVLCLITVLSLNNCFGPGDTVSNVNDPPKDKKVSVGFRIALTDTSLVQSSSHAYDSAILGISAPDMASIRVKMTLTDSAVEAVVPAVPVGLDRVFDVSVYKTGIVVVKGTDTSDIKGGQVNEINMKVSVVKAPVDIKIPLVSDGTIDYRPLAAENLTDSLSVSPWGILSDSVGDTNHISILERGKSYTVDTKVSATGAQLLYSLTPELRIMDATGNLISQGTLQNFPSEIVMSTNKVYLLQDSIKSVSLREDLKFSLSILDSARTGTYMLRMNIIALPNGGSQGNLPIHITKYVYFHVN